MLEALSMMGGGGGGRGVFWRRNVVDCLCRLGLHITIGGASRGSRRPSSDAVLSRIDFCGREESSCVVLLVCECGKEVWDDWLRCLARLLPHADVQAV
jgi:hypothetical protein